MISQSRCPICTSHEQEVIVQSSLQDTAAAEIVRCRSCRFIYHPAPVGTYTPDQHGRENASLSIHAEPVPDDTLAYWLSLLERTVARGMLLDIGCGSGHFLDLARAHGWRIAGVESSVAAEDARKLLSDTPVESSLCEGLWPAGSFDAVTIWGGLEHCNSPAQLLRLAAHYCRVDGALVVQVRNGEQHGKRRHTSSAAECGVPTQLFSLLSLQHFLSRFGFRTEYIESSCQAEGEVRQAVGMNGTSRVHSQRAYSFPITAQVFRHANPSRTPPEYLTVIARYIP